MDQAERLRTLVKGSQPRARVIAITSGKGGVGKTSVAVNLALALNGLGKRVVIVDVDIGLANVDVMCGVQPTLHVGNVLAGEVQCVDALTEVVPGLELLSGSPGVQRSSDLERTEREFLIRSLKELETHADFVIIDTAAGISRNVVHFASVADEIVVVTTPEPTAITDGYAVVKAISREKGFGRIRLLVNMARDQAEAVRVCERLRAVSRRFLGLEVNCLGYVVADDNVRLAVRQRRPFLLEYPRTPASQCLQALAERFLGEEPEVRSPGFFKRFANVIQGVMS